MRHRPVPTRPHGGGRRRPARGDDGYVLATMGLVLVPLLLFTAFAVDVGGWYARGAKLQRAADAAALAGAARMPDFDAAKTQAIQTAKLNGIVDSATIDIDVNQGANDRQLRVTITDRNVARFLSSIVLKNMTIKRSSTAEFVLPVPLGSPENSYGTDPFPVGPFTDPGLWGNIHGEQTDNQKGDRYAAGCRNTGEAGCSTKVAEHVGSYIYSIDVLTAGATIDVEVFDAGIFERKDEQTETGDTNYGTQTAQTTTWELFYRDDTPLDAVDNIDLHSMATGPSPERCSAGPGKFVIPQGANYGTAPTAAQAPVQALYKQKWVSICSKTSAPVGRYYLKVSSTGNGNSANRYSIRVKSSSATKPRLSAYQNMSMFNNDLGSNPQFYLAQVDSIHKGKTFIVNLYDPGEIGVPNAKMVIQKPAITGTAVGTTSCKVYVFNNPTDTNPSSGPVTYPGCSIPTTTGTAPYPGIYAGKLLRIEIDLGTAYACATCWWKVLYELNGVKTGNPADTTTWSAAIKGDPVHLIND